MKEIQFSVDIKDSVLPFVSITEGAFKGFNFLVDTGCTKSLLFAHAVEDHQDFLEVEEEGAWSKVTGIDGTSQRVLNVRGKIIIAEEEMNVRFNLYNDMAVAKSIERDLGIVMHGIIGNDIMIPYGWVIDLANQKIIIEGKSAEAA